MKFFYGYLKITKKLKTKPKKSNFDFFWICEVFLFLNGLFKVLQCSNPDSMLWKLHQKAKFRLFKHNDLWQLGFQNGKKDENFDFTEIFSFLISNIFAELFVTHKTIYIFWKNSLSSTEKCKIKSFYDILSKSRGLSKWQNFENRRFRQSLEALNSVSEKKKIVQSFDFLKE